MAHEMFSIWMLALLLFIQIVQCFPSSRLSTGALGAPISNCATLPEYDQWFQPSKVFDFGDCTRAIDIFYHDYVKDHNHIPYEFLTSGVDPVHGIPTRMCISEHFLSPLCGPLNSESCSRNIYADSEKFIERLPLKIAYGERIAAVPTQCSRSVIDPSQVLVWLRSLCDTNSNGATYQARNRFDQPGRM